MAAVQAFARSDAGRITAATCRVWGVDPGTLLHDDVLGFNLRIALANQLGTPSEPGPVGDPVDAGWDEAGAAFRDHVKRTTRAAR